MINLQRQKLKQLQLKQLLQNQLKLLLLRKKWLQNQLQIQKRKQLLKRNQLQVLRLKDVVDTPDVNHLEKATATASNHESNTQYTAEKALTET